MGKVTFQGSVSAQAEEGEVITITVKLSDASEDVLTATTNPDGTFSTSKEYPAGAYSATFHINADAEYKAADFGPVTFDVPLADRTITATITVT